MSKKAVIQKINSFSRLAADSMRQRAKDSSINGMRDWHDGRIAAFNMASSMLARDVGIASATWDRPLLEKYKADNR